MSKQLKYNQLIENQGIKGLCPDKDVFENSIDAFRWCTLPLTDVVNFLPNLKEDEVRNRPPRRLKDDNVEKCGLCAISFFDNLSEAKKRFYKFGYPIRNKLGYTHIAIGKLINNDGLLTPVVNNHFMLFEYENTDLSGRFVIADSL